MRSLFLIPVIMLAACQDIPKPNYYTPLGVSPSQYKALYHACIAKEAATLDDGISPADVIGRSIANACNKEYIPYAMQFVANDNQAVQNAYYHRITNDQDAAAGAPTQYVLSRRDYFNKHKK